MESFLFIGHSSKLNVVFILDSSSNSDVKNMKTFIRNSIGNYEISSEKVNIGIVVTSPKIQEVLSPNEGVSAGEVNYALSEILPHGEGESMKDVLSYLRESVFNELRDGSRTLVILLTVRKIRASERENVGEAIQALKQQKDSYFTVIGMSEDLLEEDFNLFDHVQLVGSSRLLPNTFDLFDRVLKRIYGRFWLSGY